MDQEETRKPSLRAWIRTRESPWDPSLVELQRLWEPRTSRLAEVEYVYASNSEKVLCSLRNMIRSLSVSKLPCARGQ